MSSRLRISVSALLFLITPIASLAQSTPPQAPPTVHETVVVTATGRETPESKVGASIAVVNRDEIEQRHALSTIDLLRTIPGMVAVRSGGIGNLTSVFVRGGESTYNKVLLDGMPLNEPGGAFNFASLSPENIERIEVLRGAHSALFGSDAMASVIQLFSVRPRGRAAAGARDGGRRQLRHRAPGGGVSAHGRAPSTTRSSGRCCRLTTKSRTTKTRRRRCPAA
jgi:vitamin B12 transporter